MAGGIAALAIPASAGAATQIGQTGTPDASCGATFNLVQSATAGPPEYAVPPGFGVITSWSYQGFPPDPGSGKMIVWRPTTQVDQFIVVGKTAAESFTASVSTFPTRISVQPGDVLGARISSHCLRSAGSSGDDVVRYNDTTSEPADGSTQTLGLTLSGFRIVVAATVEPDCDSDGLGDETQDPELTGPNCPPPPESQPEPQPQPKADGTLTIDANKGKVEKGRKVTLSGQYDVAVNESCEPNRAVEIQRKTQKAPDSEFETFTSVQTDATGNYTTKVKIKKTRVYRAVVPETDACDDETSNSQKVRVQKKKAAQEA